MLAKVGKMARKLTKPGKMGYQNFIGARKMAVYGRKAITKIVTHGIGKTETTCPMNFRPWKDILQLENEIFTSLVCKHTRYSESEQG
jgi:hypothetical protein